MDVELYVYDLSKVWSPKCMHNFEKSNINMRLGSCTTGTVPVGPLTTLVDHDVQLSRQFLGIHIEAVYHTSIVFGGIEYFYGAGKILRFFQVIIY